LTHVEFMNTCMFMRLITLLHLFSDVVDPQAAFTVHCDVLKSTVQRETQERGEPSFQLRCLKAVSHPGINGQ